MFPDPVLAFDDSSVLNRDKISEEENSHFYRNINLTKIVLLILQEDATMAYLDGDDCLCLVTILEIQANYNISSMLRY